jgi:hypothetical protein
MTKATVEWEGVKLSVEVEEDYVLDDLDKLHEMLKCALIGCGFHPNSVKYDE